MENISSGVIEESLIKVLWTNMHIGWKETSNFMSWNNWGNLSWESLKGKGETALRFSEKRRKSTRPPPLTLQIPLWLPLAELNWEILIKVILCTWGLNSKAKYCSPHSQSTETLITEAVDTEMSWADLEPPESFLLFYMRCTFVLLGGLDFGELSWLIPW